MIISRIIEKWIRRYIWGFPYYSWGTRWRSWMRHCATSRKIAGSIPMVSLELFINIFLPAAIWPRGRNSLYKQWVPGIFPGLKAAGLWCWQCYHLGMQIFLKSGRIKLLGPSWPVQWLYRDFFYRYICFIYRVSQSLIQGVTGGTDQTSGGCSLC